METEPRRRWVVIGGIVGVVLYLAYRYYHHTTPADAATAALAEQGIIASRFHDGRVGDTQVAQVPQNLSTPESRVIPVTANALVDSPATILAAQQYVPRPLPTNYREQLQVQFQSLKATRL